MGLINTFERRFRWLAFPSLLRGLAIIHFVVILLLMMRPQIGLAMTFDWAKILDGEVWRVISFLFLSVSAPVEGTAPGFSSFSIFFAFISLMIAFLFNDALEHAWGVWRTSAYFYGVALGQIVANIFLSSVGLYPHPEGGMYLYLAAFFAFATLFPNHSFMIMFIIPVKVWILAALSGLLIVVSALGSLPFAIFVILTFLPYLWWAVPVAIRNGRNRSAIAKRRVDFQSKSRASERGSFHRCKQCGATEISHPDLEFRVAEDDEEICTNCIEL